MRAHAYDSATHEFLTSSAASFYNRHFDQKIPDELLAFLRDGSRREDDPPRWMNHFYDPIHQRGLSPDNAIDPLLNLGTWHTSKAWAQDSNAQRKLAYSPLIATILSSLQSGKIEKYLPTSDFAWKEALRYQIQGEAEMAAFSLGHVLHLIQDMSVPDHTRNDAHPGDSPYENYAGQFTSQNPDQNLVKRLTTYPVMRCDTLDACFEKIATYSNNNFYSKNTIGIQSGFDLPQPLEQYAFDNLVKSKDADGNEYYLFTQNKTGRFNYIKSTTQVSLIDKESVVVNSYWSLLSPKAVQYSAAVLDLFLQEAEKNKDNPEFAKASKKSFFAQAIATAQEFAQSAFDSLSATVASLFSPDSLFRDAYVSNLSDNGQTDAREPQSSPSIIEGDKNSLKETNLSDTGDPHLVLTADLQEKNEGAQQDERTPTPSPSRAPKSSPHPALARAACPLENIAHTAASSVIFNEIAWMGGPTSSSDEWIELKNIAGKPVDLGGWSIRNKSGSIDISLSKLKNPLLAHGQLVLLERTDDKSSPAPLRAHPLHPRSLRP